MALDKTLFTTVVVPNGAPRTTKIAPKKAPKKDLSAEQPMEGPAPIVRKSESSQPEADVVIDGAEAVLRNIEASCHGNRYLEAMVLGEILNSPRF